jgi:hypothetical protein
MGALHAVTFVIIILIHLQQHSQAELPERQRHGPTAHTKTTTTTTTAHGHRTAAAVVAVAAAAATAAAAGDRTTRMAAHQETGPARTRRTNNGCHSAEDDATHHGRRHRPQTSGHAPTQWPRAHVPPQWPPEAPPTRPLPDALASICTAAASCWPPSSAAAARRRRGGGGARRGVLRRSSNYAHGPGGCAMRLCWLCAAA